MLQFENSSECSFSTDTHLQFLKVGIQIRTNSQITVGQRLDYLDNLKEDEIENWRHGSLKFFFILSDLTAEISKKNDANNFMDGGCIGLLKLRKKCVPLYFFETVKEINFLYCHDVSHFVTVTQHF